MPAPLRANLPISAPALTRVPSRASTARGGWLETGLVTSPRAASAYAGFRFPPEVICIGVSLIDWVASFLTCRAPYAAAADGCIRSP